MSISAKDILLQWYEINKGYGGFSMDVLRLDQLKIEKPNQTIYDLVQSNWDHVAKPLDGLGQFEPLIAQIGAILEETDINLKKKAVIVMCADNGVVEEGISQSGQEVTEAVTKCMGHGMTSVGKMASFIGVEVIPVDIGIAGTNEYEGVQNRKVVSGTKNFLKEPAMSEEQAMRAIETGVEMVQICREKGYKLLGTGEMGIGNTTTSSAMAAAMLGCAVSEITGRGAGLDDQGLRRKIAVIGQALNKYEFRTEEALRILCCVGGLDIAGLVGVFLGGAIYHIPVVIDGVISSVAALCAERLVPGTKDYMIPSHRSKEPATSRIMEELGVRPVIDAGLALGEGTGAVMMFALLDLALTLYQNQTTFGNMELEPYKRYMKGKES